MLLKTAQVQFSKYLELERRYSKNTIVSYNTDLNSFKTYLLIQYQLDQLSAISHGLIRSWIVSLMQGGLSPKSINRKISCLKSFFNYLKRNKLIEVNPMRKIVSPKIGKRLPKIIQEDALARLLDLDQEEAPLEMTHGALRDRLIVELFYLSGMRRMELIGLTDLSLDHAKSQLKVLGKGNKERLIPLSKVFINKLETYCKLRNETFGTDREAYLFLTDKGRMLYPKLVYNIVTRALSKTSTSEKKSPHILRHSFATHLSNNGADLNAIKELLGHASLAATQVYTHNSIEKLKEVYRRSHPSA